MKDDLQKTLPTQANGKPDRGAFHAAKRSWRTPEIMEVDYSDSFSTVVKPY